MVAHLEPCWIFFRRQRDWFLLFRRTNMLLILWICCNGVNTLNVTVCQCHGNLTFFFLQKFKIFSLLFHTKFLLYLVQIPKMSPIFSSFFLFLVLQITQIHENVAIFIVFSIWSEAVLIAIMAFCQAVRIFVPLKVVQIQLKPCIWWSC